MIKLEYKNLCPNCGKNILEDRLKKGLPCEDCLPRNSKVMKEGFLKRIEERNARLKSLEEMFQKVMKNKMWALQRFWARRFLEGESFAFIAPTGSGKTTMQIILSLYASSVKKRCLILLPTSVLANQVFEKLKDYANKLEIQVDIACYHSLLTNKEKKIELEKMDKAEIIVTTHLSLMKRDEIKRQMIDIVFVDDVDSFLKRSKAVRFVFNMIKIPNEIKNVISNLYERKIEIKDAISKIDEIKKIAKIDGQIIVSGATTRGRRTKSIILLNSIFGFTIGGRVEFSRNIVDTYLIPKNLEEDLLSLVKKLGKGGLIFVPSDKGSEYAERLEKYLEQNGIKAKAFIKPNKSYFEKFKNNEIDCLIGLTTTRSPLVRGIDLPAVIRYAIFVGVPKFLIRINTQEFHPTRWLMLLNNISQVIKDEYKRDFDILVQRLAKIKNINFEQLKIVREAIRENKTLDGFLGYVKMVAIDGMRFFEKILSDEDIVRALKESPTISFGVERNEYYFLVVDEVAYLQASGRTSRLYIGGVTKGLSIVMIDDQKAFNNLIKELEYLGEEIKWSNLEDVDLNAVIKEIDRDRNKVILAQNEKLKVREKISISTSLFIVESPNKARTIARYFGRPLKKSVGDLKTYEVFIEKSLFIITASKGHITDLDEFDGFFGVKIIRKEDKFKKDFIPVYSAIRRCIHCGRDVEEDLCKYCNKKDIIDAKQRIENLRKLASMVDNVIIGTDPDAEGEKIAFDLYLLLRPYNKNIKRAVFHEVTKKEILKSLNNLEDFNLNLVKAQVVRRIQDRWIGFSISPILWKVFKNNNLSAGRVQTPVLGWIDERTKKLKEKEELVTIKLINGLTLSFRSELGTFKKILKERKVKILKVENKIEELNPYPPFTTDTLISSLSSALNISANDAMRIAQKLFENGLITYHRTSSTTVSDVGIAIAREYISSNFGKEYVKERKWQMEGAHECIRPTKAIDVQRLRSMLALKSIRAYLSEDDIRAYDIIFKRFIASQMRPTKVEKIVLNVLVCDKEISFEFTKRIVEDGFSKLIPLSTKEIPEIKEGEVKISFVKRKIVPRHYPFTYSEIVAMMKEKGIGRPSTYAKILEILKRRNYVEEIDKKLITTKLGSKVYNFLKNRYDKYLNEELTKDLEEKMDKIESNEIKAENVVRGFYEEVLEIMADAIKLGVNYH